MCYLENLQEAMIAANEKARKQGDGKAWDNVKAKTKKRMTPRGKFFKRFHKQEHTRIAYKLMTPVIPFI